ncbi:hypothetical protein [Pseudovibrio sp. Tun.PSC04-5.I4]|uniref:hypothetical protein n=1 Tax=Pseudovibrio sp. Tun.PSC04-5.I4 TaxID=1798213 RepID=UPI0008887942|nr:hypothetical protein [Pseudovibrio sp. Tun.PSC04-5.I4]SDQ78638.1 hypothetical protein SAMN04515695_1392 [Pseudovibrio sp. Tun.PSC04-5.I4]
MPFNKRGMAACISAAACTVVVGTLLGSAAIAAETAQLTPNFVTAQSAYNTAWKQQSLVFTSAKFIALPAKGYGSYTPLVSAEFQSGDPLIVYAEPLGYAYQEQNGQFMIDLSVDFELRNTTGQVLASQDDFAELHSESFSRIREYQSSLSFNLQGLQAGEYVLKVRFNDENSEKSGSFELPFLMKATPLQN